MSKKRGCRATKVFWPLTSCSSSCCCRGTTRLRRNRPTQAILRLADALSYLEENYQRPLELAELAAKANLSKNQFLRVFKKAFGRTPMTYLAERRIQKAQRLLKDTSLPISQIAFDTGFADSNYFLAAFAGDGEKSQEL